MEGSIKVKKAIIPVAGLGTRMLPATKAIPKELLPILDKPLIQIVVEEAIQGGIEEIIFVTRSGKEAIENHFDVNFELEHKLETSGKKKILKNLKNSITKKVKITSIRQEEALGLGHAILCANHLINDEPFAVLLPDEILMPKEDSHDFAEMLSYYEKSGKGQILVEKVSKKMISNYGVVDINGSSIRKSISASISKLVEKPKQHKSPSNLRIVGRYILPFKIMSILLKQKKGKDGEIQLTDALDNLVKNHPSTLQAFLSNSDIFDCGSKKGFFGANLAMALRDKDMKKYIKEIVYK